MIAKPDSRFFSQVADMLLQEREHVARQVNSAMVLTYFEIGRMIVEEEQNGKERADYGKELLKGLSDYLNREFVRGFSVDNLENMRRFYLTYGNSETLSRNSLGEKSETVFRISDAAENSSQILQTLSEELQDTEPAKPQTPSAELRKSAKVSRKFTLSWSHYLILMRMDDPDERGFYEIESAECNWSVRELKRQVDSALYQRLALSRDKESVKRQERVLADGELVSFAFEG